MTGSTRETSDLAPGVSLAHLDDLWFQVAGTLCNLTCHHCFISCSPHNHSFGFLTLQDIRRRLKESVALGVKEYYFTGGEPFLNRDMTAILVETLRYGPATVLTNGTVFKDEWLQALAAAEASSPYSLEFRVSIDGFSPETNDPIRGEGTFERAMRGVIKLVEHGFLPIITAARTWPEERELEVVGRFVAMLQARGCARPRLKILPTLRIGAEEQRTHGYLSSERVTQEMMDGFDASQLVCEHSRIVTDRGVFVCPILIDSPDARLGDTLESACVEYSLRHGACYTCYQYGSICSNAGRVESGESRVESQKNQKRRIPS
jgi:molybdenum cofactor biosynthesis enzyme MoaA